MVEAIKQLTCGALAARDVRVLAAAPSNSGVCFGVYLCICVRLCVFLCLCVSMYECMFVCMYDNHIAVAITLAY